MAHQSEILHAPDLHRPKCQRWVYKFPLKKTNKQKKNLRLAGKKLSKFKASVGRANKRIANRFFFSFFFQRISHGYVITCDYATLHHYTRLARLLGDVNTAAVCGTVIFGSRTGRIFLPCEKEMNSSDFRALSRSLLSLLQRRNQTAGPARGLKETTRLR